MSTPLITNYDSAEAFLAACETMRLTAREPLPIYDIEVRLRIDTHVYKSALEAITAAYFELRNSTPITFDEVQAMVNELEIAPDEAYNRIARQKGLTK